MPPWPHKEPLLPIHPEETAVAGWTFNRQAKGQAKNKQPAEQRRTAADGPDRARSPEPFTMDDMLAGANSSRLVSSQQAQLSRVVELEIIPRLMLLHRLPHMPRAPLPQVQITAEQVQALTELAADGTPEATIAFVRQVLDDGATQEQVFLDLLAASARLMGEWWEQDLYNFSQVTIGLWRLQRVLHEFSEPLRASVRRDGDSRRVLLAAVPGSQHTFGIALVAEFFSRASWEVACEPRLGWAELAALARRDWFDVVGLSVSASDSVAEVASGILDIRRASGNPGLFVMVGGPMAGVMPDLARRCGADAMAGDAPSAVDAANASLRRSVKTA